MRMKPKDSIFYEGRQEYPCMNWHHHVVLGLNESEGDGLFTSPPGAYLTSHLADFASQSLYFWLNTLLLQGYQQTMVSDLHSRLSLLKVCGPPDTSVAQQTNKLVLSST